MLRPWSVWRNLRIGLWLIELVDVRYSSATRLLWGWRLGLRRRSCRVLVVGQICVVAVQLCWSDACKGDLLDTAAWTMNLQPRVRTRFNLKRPLVWGSQRWRNAASPNKDVGRVLEFLWNVDVWLPVCRCWFWLQPLHFESQIAEQLATLAIELDVLVGCLRQNLSR